MTWILILFFGPTLQSTGGRAITTQEFIGKEACVKAGELSKSQTGLLYGSVYYVCTEKN